MKTTALILIATTMSISSNAFAAADLAALENDLDVYPVESCGDGIELYKEGDLKGAVELISLCHDEMMQISEQIAVTAFVDEIMGFSGDKLRQQNAMGFSQIERRYRNGEQIIEVSLGSGKGASIMQSIIGIAGRKTRIGKYSGYIITQSNDITVYIPFDDKSMTFKSTTADQKLIKKFAKIFMKGIAN